MQTFKGRPAADRLYKKKHIARRADKFFSPNPSVKAYSKPFNPQAKRDYSLPQKR